MLSLKPKLNVCSLQFAANKFNVATVAPTVSKVRGEFDEDLTVPFLFSVIDSQQKNSADNLRRFNQFAAAANKRIAELEAEVKRLQS